MKKIFLPAIIFFLIVNAVHYPAAALELHEECVPPVKQFVLYLESYDFGGGVNKIVLHTKKPVFEKQIAVKDFEIEWGRGTRTVQDAYLCDPNGLRLPLSAAADGAEFVAIELYCGPDENCNPFAGTMFFGSKEIIKIEIENDEIGFSSKKCAGIVNHSASKFKIDEYTSSRMTLQYAYYLPGNPEAFRDSNIEVISDSEKIPLIIWFHAVGEGGKNPYVPLFGQRAVNLAEEKIQSYFENGAAVLVPLSPTSWLETVELDAMGNKVWAPVDVFSKMDKLSVAVANAIDEKRTGGKNQVKEDEHPADSYYTVDVKELIDAFITKNPRIDTSRIYIGGCSAGGYMTLNMIFNYPDYFAAAFPVCAAYPDSRITDSNIEVLRRTPVWFVLSLADQTVNPEPHTLKTFARIKAAADGTMPPDAGSEPDAHLTTFEKVIDLSNQYKGADGGAFEYDGHFSWIYVLNDRVSENGTSLFRWLSGCRLPQ